MYDYDILYIGDCMESWPRKLNGLLPDGIKMHLFLGLHFMYFLLRWSDLKFQFSNLWHSIFNYLGSCLFLTDILSHKVLPDIAVCLWVWALSCENHYIWDRNEDSFILQFKTNLVLILLFNVNKNPQKSCSLVLQEKEKRSVVMVWNFCDYTKGTNKFN